MKLPIKVLKTYQMEGVFLFVGAILFVISKYFQLYWF